METKLLTDPEMIIHLEQVTKCRLAEVTEARFKLLEAVQTSNLANIEWWTKELLSRQNCHRHWQDKLDHSRKLASSAGVKQ